VIEGTSRNIKISDITVFDETGNQYPFTTSTRGGNLTIKIGDPNTLITGTHLYHIAYNVSGAISFLKDFDELYWNAVGTQWNIPITSVKSTITLPSGHILQAACYRGITGSNTSCTVASSTDERTYAVEEANLTPGEGITVAIGFPKGIVTPPTIWQRIKDIFISSLILVVIPILLFIILYTKWYRHGRDPQGRGTIVTQFDPPANISPLQAGFIIDQRMDPRDITAEIIYLAVSGRSGTFVDSLSTFLYSSIGLKLLYQSTHYSLRKGKR